MKEDKLYVTLCGLLILLWAYAGVTKLLSFHLFQIQMAKQILPGFAKVILAKMLPGGELALAIILCIERFRRVGLYISLLLLIAFTLYIGLAVFKVFPKRPCSCGGILAHIGWSAHFIFNLVFTALNLLTIVIYKGKEGLARKVSI